MDNDAERREKQRRERRNEIVQNLTLLALAVWAVVNTIALISK